MLENILKDLEDCHQSLAHAKSSIQVGANALRKSKHFHVHILNDEINALGQAFFQINFHIQSNIGTFKRKSFYNQFDANEVINIFIQRYKQK